MSLEQKLGGSGDDFKRWLYTTLEKAVGAADGKYLQLHSWLAETWQNKTYRSKNDLQTGAYLASFAGFGAHYATDTSSYISLVPPTVTGLLAIFSRYPDQDEDKIEKELMNRDLASREVDVFLFSTGAIFVAGSALSVGVSYTMGNHSQYYDGVSGLSLWLGLLFATAGHYLYRIDPGDPPRRQKKKSLADRLKEIVEQFRPEPARIPAEVNS